MNKMLTLWLAAVLVTCSASLSAAVPAAAAAADPMSTMDCSQAEAMLDSAVSSKASTIMTGDVDKDFAALMILHEKVGKRIDQIEAKCGKDPKMQAMAAKGSDGAQQRMDEFHSVGTSQ